MKAIQEMGYESPMPVQEEVIPFLLGEDNDVIALAQTGTGKTAAFGLPILQKIDVTRYQPQALILCPTRELCLQIADDLNDYSKYIDNLKVLPVYGGSSIESQIKTLKRGVHVVVATPGRLLDLMNRKTVDLSTVKNVILDEADEMLNMGFTDSINAILAEVPPARNMLLFSATMPQGIASIMKKYMKNPKEIVIGNKNEGNKNIKDIYYMVRAQDKYLALKRIADYYPNIYGIVFCRTRKETQEIADKLIQDGYNADSLHGELSQAQRDYVMQKFRVKNIQLLVATDVAARGLDVDDLTHVINYGLPDDIESYTHRSGRTGRAGKKGTSISIIHTRERHKVKAIEKVIGKSFVDGDLPSPKEICTKQLYKAIDEIEKVDVNEEEIAPFMEDINRHFEYVDKEDILKKIVSLEFGRFLAYYADAPEIVKPSTERARKGEARKDGKKARARGRRKAENWYCKLFVNQSKDDGFYPGEVMQFLNKNMRGHQEVGHIDLLGKFSYIEVPEEDAAKVMRAIDGRQYRGRTVRCNDADDRKRSDRRTKKDDSRDDFGRYEKKSKKRNRAADAKPFRESGRKDDWRQFIDNPDIKLVGEEPDFSEEGWARRRPRKK